MIENTLFPEQPEVYQRYWSIEKILKIQKIIDQGYLAKAALTRGETFKMRKLALWIEVGELVNEWKELFKYWSGKKMDRESALEEYVDGIHFILSLGNDLNIPGYHDTVVKFKDPIDHIFTLGVVISNISGVQSFFDAFSLYRGLGDHLGFNEREIEEAFHRKSEKNIKREDHNIQKIEGMSLLDYK